MSSKFPRVLAPKKLTEYQTIDDGVYIEEYRIITRNISEIV